MPIEPDKLTFTPATHGMFSIKECIEHTRSWGIERRWANWIWNPCFPPNLSTFLWKVLRHALHVNSGIQTRGILLASRYCCCKEFNTETLVHLFINLEVELAVWKCFGEFYNIPHTSALMHRWTIIQSHINKFSSTERILYQSFRFWILL